MMSSWVKIKLAFVAVLVLATAVMGCYVSALRQKNVRLERDLVVALSSTSLLAIEAAKGNRAFIDRAKEMDALTAENRALKLKIGTAYELDKDAEEWSITLCPDGVLDCLWDAYK